MPLRASLRALLDRAPTLAPDDPDLLETERAMTQQGLSARLAKLVGGNRVLALWHQEKDLFVKVMPQDYKRVLAAQTKAREAGQDELQAIMAAAHG